MCVEDLGVPVDLSSPRWTTHCHQHCQRGAHHSEGIPRFLQVQPHNGSLSIAGRPGGGALPHDPHLTCLHLLLDCCIFSQVIHTNKVDP